MTDIIVAISTTLGVGAISIVRISGKGSIELINTIFKGKDLTKVESHTINYGHIICECEIIDEVLVTIMKSPKTFTTEDLVEINCHGSISTTNKILQILLDLGCRMAEPGEFTKRAFLNGRIDLTQAEAVMDLIESKTDKSRKISMSQLNGNLTKVIRNFRQDLLEILANIEVNIDYPEYEDIEVVTIGQLSKTVVETRKRLANILEISKNNQAVKTGINVAIVGKPNVGKSSILNGLLGEDKAIVTDIAGTTRDIVEGSLVLDGILYNFIDTAGIRETSDIVEKYGVEKSLGKIEFADLVIVVINNNEELSIDDRKILDRVKDKRVIIAINKSDLESKLNIEEMNTFSKSIVYTNTLEINGLNELINAMKEIFMAGDLEQNDYVMFTNVRQISLANECLSILTDVETGIENEVPIDIVAIDLKKIWEKLGEIIGENYSEELVNQLFSQFCLGK